MSVCVIRKALSKHVLPRPHPHLISAVGFKHIGLTFCSPIWLCICMTGDWIKRGCGGGTFRTLRLLLLPLVSCFGLFPLNHAAAHNAVKTAQVEEGDGPKQPHGHNLQVGFAK